MKDIKNRKDLLSYIEGYGNHIEFIFGDCYGFQKRYEDNFYLYTYEKNPAQPVLYNVEFIDKKEIYIDDLVDLIKKVYRHEKLKRILK
jgi:hypothetical protein